MKEGETVREFWKKTATRAIVGFALGMLVGLGIMAVGGVRAFYERHGAGRVAMYLAMSGLLGAVNVGTTTIYSLEHWGVLRCTLTHFAIAMTTICAVGFSCGWFSIGDPLTLWILLSETVAYFIIWLVMYLRCKREIRQINEALKGWKNSQGDE